MASPSSPETNIASGKDVDVIKQELDELQKKNKKLQEEKESLQIRVQGVQTLGNLLKRSQDEANSLKRRVKELSEELVTTKKNASQISASQQESFLFVNDQKSLQQKPDHSNDEDENVLSERVNSEISDTSMLSSAWNSGDADELKEILSKLEEMQVRNTQMANRLETTLKEQKSLNHDEALLDQLNSLKNELEDYKKQTKGHDEWLDKLSDDTSRLQKKLTSTALRRGSQFSCLQDEIDAIKAELGVLEESVTLQKQKEAEKVKAGMFSSDLKKAEVELQQKVSDPGEKIGNFPPQVIKRKEDLASKKQGENIPPPPPQMDQVKLRPRNLGQLEEQNRTLQKQVAELKKAIDTISQEKEEIIKINHVWDEQYRKLQEYMNDEIKRRDTTVSKLQRQISEDHHKMIGDDGKTNILEQKDQIIDQLTNELQLMREEANRLRLDSLSHVEVEPRERKNVDEVWKHAQKMLDDERKERELIEQREHACQEQCKAMGETIQVLQKQLEVGDTRKKFLENEVRRLAQIVETAHLGLSEDRQGSNSSPPSLVTGERQKPSAPPPNRQVSIVSEEQIEVLKQQLAVYAEDFNTERAEKEKIMEENAKLKEEIKVSREQSDTCSRQLKIYETDFKKEREERIRLMRICGQLPQETLRFQQTPVSQPGYYMPYYPPNFPRMEQPTSSQMRRYGEYIQLVNEKQRLSEKILELERQGVDRIAHRTAHQPFLPTEFYPRGSPTAPIPPPSPKDRNSDEMFYGGDVVRDGIQRKRTPPKSPRSYTCPTCEFSFRSEKDFLDHAKVCYP